jgi:hypothetical protein
VGELIELFLAEFFTGLLRVGRDVPDRQSGESDARDSRDIRRGLGGEKHVNGTFLMGFCGRNQSTNSSA